MDIKNVLENLIERKDMSFDEAKAVMDYIASGKSDKIQTAAFLALMSSKKSSAEEIAGFASAMRQHSIHVSFPSDMKLLDIVGTGGDGHGTVNISTTSAIVSATCGANVCKHGNRSASSQCGTADVLEELGVPMLKDPHHISKCVVDCGIAFMFAPNFHPAMAHVSDVRKSLKIKTVFNILGPLLNPANAQRLMLGVYLPSLLEIFAGALSQLNVEHALVVHCQGLDELAPIGVAECIEVVKGQPIKKVLIDPLDFGIPRCEIKDLKGGDKVENAKILRSLLEGKCENDAVVNAVALNTGAALYVYGIAPSIKDGVKMALDKIKSGDCAKVLDKWSKCATECHDKEQHGHHSDNKILKN